MHCELNGQLHNGSPPSERSMLWHAFHCKFGDHPVHVLSRECLPLEDAALAGYRLRHSSDYD